MILFFWFFSIIDVSFWLFSIRTRERRYWEGFVHAVHYKSRKSHLQVGRVSWLRDHRYAQIFGSLFCNVATLSRNVATSILPLSVTSRRGFPTSRRQFSYSLSRRDVDFQRRDVNFHDPLERRDVGNQRRDLFNSTLYNVATLPRTSRRCPVFRPRIVHFALHLAHTTTRTLASLAHLSSPALPEPPVTPVGGSYIALRPSLSTPQSPSPTGPLSPPHSPYTHVALTLVWSTTVGLGVS